MTAKENRTMTDECFRLDELDALLDLRAGDPRQRHLAECPLCRARLAAYRAFLADKPPLPGSRPGEAASRLEEFIEKTIRGGPEPAGSRGEPGFWARMRLGSGWRRGLALGVTAAAAVILIVILVPFRDGGRRRIAPLRGLEPSGTGESAFAAHRAVAENGSVVFSWSPVPEADGYEIHMFNTALDETARFEAGADTGMRVRIDEIPQTGTLLLWRVVAVREGGEIARSPLRSLDLRQ
jgi:hypothetical protein